MLKNRTETPHCCRDLNHSQIQNNKNMINGKIMLYLFQIVQSARMNSINFAPNKPLISAGCGQQYGWQTLTVRLNTGMSPATDWTTKIVQRWRNASSLQWFRQSWWTISPWKNITLCSSHWEHRQIEDRYEILVFTVHVPTASSDVRWMSIPRLRDARQTWSNWRRERRRRVSRRYRHDTRRASRCPKNLYGQREKGCGKCSQKQGRRSTLYEGSSQNVPLQIVLWNVTGVWRRAFTHSAAPVQTSLFRTHSVSTFTSSALVPRTPQRNFHQTWKRLNTKKALMCRTCLEWSVTRRETT